MVVSFSPSVNFGNSVSKTEQQATVIKGHKGLEEFLATQKGMDDQTYIVVQNPKNAEDILELATPKDSEAPKKKLSLKERIGNVAKAFVAMGEMTKGTLKGFVYGSATGIAFLGGSWMFDALPKGFRKGGSLKEVCKNPFKSVSTKGKVLAGVAALAVATYQIVAAKLKTNQRTANIDHQLNIGHRDE